jgi:hypothetical protein
MLFWVGFGETEPDEVRGAVQTVMGPDRTAS